MPVVTWKDLSLTAIFIEWSNPSYSIVTGYRVAYTDPCTGEMYRSMLAENQFNRTLTVYTGQNYSVTVAASNYFGYGLEAAVSVTKYESGIVKISLHV